MPSLDFTLRLSPDDILPYYRGEARTVIAELDDGHTVQFPAAAVQRFVTKNGIHGRFRIWFDEDRKFLRIERIGADTLDHSA